MDSLGTSWCDLQTEFGCLLPEELYLSLPVPSFVVLRTFVDVLLTILEHSIDQSGKAMCHGGNGFGSAESAAQASVLRTEVCLAFQ
jgi:hypothetical protein